MLKHCSDVHYGQTQEFSMSILKRHQTPFDRMITESVVITHGQRDHTMNSKKEYMGESLPRLTVEVKDRVYQVDHNGKPLITPTATSTSITSTKRKPLTTTSSKKNSKRSRTSTVQQGMAGDWGREGWAPPNPTGSIISYVMITEAQEVADGTTSITSNDSTKNKK